jgi:hypothetical protein
MGRFAGGGRASDREKGIDQLQQENIEHETKLVPCSLPVDK